MKILFIEARKKIDASKIRKVIEHISNKLPKKLGLVALLQYLPAAKTVKAVLEKEGKKVFTASGKKTAYEAQIIGCDIGAAQKIANNVDAFILLGSGKFHALALASTGKSVWVVNESGFEFINYDQAKETRTKVALTKFLAAYDIGILVSIKPGQEQLGLALKIKEALKKKGKNAIVLLCNEIAERELENFSFASYINTACPGLAFYSKNLLNTKEIESFLNSNNF